MATIESVECFDLVTDWPLVEEMLEQGSRIEHVLDDGLTLLRFSNGGRCMIRIPREAAPLFRRLAVLQLTEEESVRRRRS